MQWLPVGFEHPTRLDLRSGHHLRPIRADDVEIDFPAVMGSRQRLWEIYGEAWGWPPATMTAEQDREDLARHEGEIEAHESFNYAVLDEGETELFGCVYVDPDEPAGADGSENEGAGAVVSWWVVDRAVGTELEAALDEAVPRWLDEGWPFTRVHVGVVPPPPAG